MRLRPGPIREAFTTARLTAAYARRTGAPIDEASDAVAEGVERRRLLQGSAVVAAAAALPLRFVDSAVAQPSVNAAKSQPKVVIVGAGIAGLGCALRLRHLYGIHSEVYEYDDRPGGRIRTLRGHFSDQQLVEEHAEFINPEHTHTLALVKQLDLELDNTDRYRTHNPDQITMRFNGSSVNQHKINKDWHEFGWKLFHAAAAKAPFPTLYTTSTKAGRHFDSMSVHDWINKYVPGGVDGDFGQLCISAVLDEYGGSAAQQSALNLVYLLGGDATTNNGNQPRSAPELAGGDERWHVHGGTDLLTNAIVGRLPTGAINYNQKLVRVRARGHGRYTLTFDSGSDNVEVTADHVVLALPFTTLRDVDLTGVDIGPRHRRAIDHEPLGSNAKFFMQFDERVWNAAGETGNAYCDGVLQGTWDATNYQPGKPGILAALPGGVEAEQWGERYGLSDYRGTPPVGMVEEFLYATEQLFPGAANVYNRKAFYVWSSGDPHIKGAYSYLKVGQYTGFNGIQGRREGNLHFAGEHTSIGYQGYIEGGLRSGERCADEIAGKG